jgi:hypothetical protein
MHGRRSFLKGLLAVLALPGLRRGAAPDGFHLVNGWILTGRDVAALDTLAGRRAG